MTTKWQRLAGLLSVLIALGIGACDEADADPNVNVLHDGEAADDDHIDFTPVDHDITFRTAFENGEELNGTALNGRTFNGRTFNGMALVALVERVNGALLAAVHINGTPLTNIELTNGSLLRAYDTGSQTTKVGAQLANTVFQIGFDPLSSGTDAPVTVKINAVVQSGVQSDVYFYTVDQLNDDDEFETLCRDGAGLPTQAIALPNTWDPTTAVRQSSGGGRFTWGCRGAALAKAVEWGYRPWVSAAMDDAHQAAMRMIRADYCGDGVTHTTNGNPIDVSDKWGIQTPDTTWQIEAKWGPNGAVCLNTPRKLQWPRSSIPCAASLPYCTNNGLAGGVANTSPSQYGGLLMTQVVPNSNPSAY